MSANTSILTGPHIPISSIELGASEVYFVASKVAPKSPSDNDCVCSVAKTAALRSSTQALGIPDIACEIPLPSVFDTEAKKSAANSLFGNADFHALKVPRPTGVSNPERLRIDVDSSFQDVLDEVIQSELVFLRAERTSQSRSALLRAVCCADCAYLRRGFAHGEPIDPHLVEVKTQGSNRSTTLPPSSADVPVQNIPAPLSYSIEQLATATSVSRSAIYEAIAQGELRAHKCGRRTVVLHCDAQEWLRALPTFVSGKV